MDDWRELKVMVKALAGVARLSILYHLARHNEMTVTTLTEMLHISQPLVSWHLRKLERAGLIETRRIGRQVYCSLNLQRFQQCLQKLEGLVQPNGLVEQPPVGTTLIEADTESED